MSRELAAETTKAPQQVETASGNNAAQLAVRVSVGLLATAVIAALILWNVPSDILTKVGSVGGALAPALTFLTVLAAATGWIITARLAGEEARRTEAEKRKIANDAHRDHIRARLNRVWGIISEAVSVKPYQPTIIEKFIIETEELYWKVDTFAAFLWNEHDLIRTCLDKCRQGNALAWQEIETKREGIPSKSPRQVVREYFMTSETALEAVFRDVFQDNDTADNIARVYNQSQEFFNRDN